MRRRSSFIPAFFERLDLFTRGVMANEIEEYSKPQVLIAWGQKRGVDFPYEMLEELSEANKRQNQPALAIYDPTDTEKLKKALLTVARLEGEVNELKALNANLKMVSTKELRTARSGYARSPENCLLSR